MKHSNISIFIPHVGCPFRCAFCAQNDISHTERAPTPGEVGDVIRDSFERIPEEQRSETEIAFFGGSFTAIPDGYMTALLETAAPYVKRDRGFKGIRCSTRPDCIDERILDKLKAYGVTAIELGAQSMDDNVLGLNRRGHTSSDVIHATKMIQSRGFETGLQMMTGLYGSTPEKDAETAEKILSLCPDTVRIYPTVIIEGTLLGKYFREGIYEPYPFEDCVDVCAAAYEMFTENGIRVIRLGLHAERSLESRMLGGYYHQAMGELVRGRIFRNRLTRLLDTRIGASADVYVPAVLISIAKGHKKANEQYFGKKVHFIPDSTLTGSTAAVRFSDGSTAGIEII